MHSRRQSAIAVYLTSLVLCGVLLCSCSGGSGGSSSGPAPNPAPTVTSLSPASAALGAASQTLTITGTDFISASTVSFNGTAHAATYVSATSLTISLSAADQATAGILPVVVSNPSPGGGASSAVNFTVNNPSPTVTSIAPAAVVVGAAAQTLTVTGTNFLAATTVTFNGTSVTPTVASSTQLTIPITAAEQSATGSFPVVVSNPTPGGGSATAANFAVNNPSPTLTSIAPAAVVVGAAAQTLTVTGTNFLAGTTVTCNGTSVTPTIASATQLTIPVTVAEQASIGSFPIVVTDPAPGGGSATISFAVTGVPVSGIVFKGASTGSTVTAYEVGADGTNGAALGSATTGTGGAFSFNLTAVATGAVRLVATGGTYPSEFDATTVSGTSGISALLDSVTSGISGVSITPASELVNSYATGLLSAKTEAAAHSEASGQLGAYLGLSKGAVIEMLTPVFDKADITASPDAFTLGLFIGSVATEGHTVVPSSPDDLIAALSADISDGVFDGKAAGTAVSLSKAADPRIRMGQAHTSGKLLPKEMASLLSPTAGTTDLLLSLGTYITTGSAVKTAGILPADVAGLQTAIAGGISACTCTPPSVGLVASSSGASTTYSVEGRQYLIVAARQEGVVVIDVTDPTSKAPPINAWPSVSSTTFDGADVGGVIAVTGLTGHPQVLAFAYESKTLAVLNLNTLITGNPAKDNPVDLKTELSLVSTNTVRFSGGSAFIAGGIPDNGRGGVWLDTADGYGLLPLSSLVAGATSVSLTNPYPVEDTANNEIVAENLGGDIKNNQLLGGNYGGIQLMELGKGKSYYLPSFGLETTLSNFSSYAFIDGASVDENLRVGILTSEDRTAAGFLNLATVTETDSTTTGTLNSFAPAAGGLVEVVLGKSGGNGGYGPVLSGSAVDKNSHLALFMAGYSTDIAVGQLQDPSTVAAGSTFAGLTDWSYFTLNDSPELADYGYGTDPHSVGVIVNQTTGTPFGYLFDGSTDRGIVQVDLANFLALKRSGTAGDEAHQPGVDPGATVSANGALVIQEFTWTDPTSAIPAIKRKTATELPLQPFVTPRKK